MGSCFFIGHRETPDRVYPTLIETIERHIAEYGVSEFVVGQYGNFDRLVIRALSQAKRAHPDIMVAMDNYSDYLLLWSPRDKKLWYLDIEHEEFHPLAKWDDFIADPGRYLNGMIEGEFEE